MVQALLSWPAGPYADSMTTPEPTLRYLLGLIADENKRASSEPRNPRPRGGRRDGAPNAQDLESGLMFWLRRRTLAGSNLRLIVARRA
jgi:hypothetical protein